ncbi:hypothetical protein llap_11728 [Limosa lapponica baueri]|uniref:Uncharacterized protein n=1 Tax=Limosa lapponica baueri TaxID=1758121 RepID=A0A2I0TVX4_LIMLA|nr:hypothetical protein llap_11728 [Limosa lapponica baueri]
MSWRTNSTPDTLCPCGSVGQPAQAQFGFILQLNEFKALKHSSETEDQQRNSNRGGEDTQDIIQVNSVVKTAEVKEPRDEFQPNPYQNEQLTQTPSSSQDNVKLIFTLNTHKAAQDDPTISTPWHGP